MKFIKKYFGVFKKTAQKNLILTIGVFIVIIVGAGVVFKSLTAKENTVFIKVKVSQGLWWASTLKPSVWLADSLHKGDKEVSLSGNPVAEIVEARRYPLGILGYSSEQYDVFLTVRVKAGFNNKTNKYSFKRSNLSIGSPVEFEFQNAHATGTILALSQQPFQDEYVEKTITLQKDLAQEWEYTTIPVGDTYSDGEDTAVRVLDKNIIERLETYNSLSSNYPVFSGNRVNMSVTLRMKLKKHNDMFLFREELPITVGRKVTLPAGQSMITEFIITDIK